MTTYYIDPTASSGGDGSFNSPFNSWESVSWGAGNTYLQKQETVFYGSVAPTLSGTLTNRIYLGTYNKNTGGLIQDKTRHAKIIAGEAEDAVNLGRSGTRNYYTINNLHLIGGHSSGSSVSGIYALGGTETTTRKIIIENCLISCLIGSGISARGIGYTIKNNTLYNCFIDGLILAGSDFLIENNFITNNDLSLVNGDGIQISTTSSCGVGIIKNNYISHREASPKQGIIFTAASGYAEISNNFVTNGGASCIAMQVPKGKVIQNIITDSKIGISILESDVLVEGNILSNLRDYGIIFTVNAATNTKIHNNTLYNVKIGVYNTTSTSTCSASCYNNLFINCISGIANTNSVAFIHGYNAYLNCTTNYTGTSLGNDVLTNILFNQSFVPTNTSGLKYTGLSLESANYHIPPSIGAFEYVAPRGTITNRGIR